MAREKPPQLSRRERQIMDVLYREGRTTAADIRAHMSDAPSDSAVRTMLRILEDKGHVRHEVEGPRYVYMPTVARDRARRSALRHVVQTFFEGSAAQAMAAIVDMAPDDMNADELNRLQDMIDRAKEKGPRR